MSKVEVDYALDKNLREEIVCAKNKIVTYLIDSKIYLFGSIAKGNYSKNSDIDLLILLTCSKGTKELRELRHELEDRIEQCRISRHVDIKLYNEERYRELCQSPCFEQCIQKDLVYIKNW